MSLKHFKSFKYAFSGIWHCIKNEKNMRIHIAVALYVLMFSKFFHLSTEKFVVLVLTISAVIAAEMVNTAIEQFCDLVSDKYSIITKIAKDVAAGSVLVSAVAAVSIGIMLFWNVEIFKNIFYYFINNLGASIIFILSLFIAYLYIDLGPVGIKEKLTFVKLKKESKG